MHHYRIKALQVPKQAPSAAVLMLNPLPSAEYERALQNMCAYQVCRGRLNMEEMCRRRLNTEETGSHCALLSVRAAHLEQMHTAQISPLSAAVVHVTLQPIREHAYQSSWQMGSMKHPVPTHFLMSYMQLVAQQDSIFLNTAALGQCIAWRRQSRSGQCSP